MFCLICWIHLFLWELEICDECYVDVKQRKWYDDGYVFE